MCLRQISDSSSSFDSFLAETSSDWFLQKRKFKMYTLARMVVILFYSPSYPTAPLINLNEHNACSTDRERVLIYFPLQSFDEFNRLLK